MEDGFRRLLARLPFPILEIHPDNGSEFLNYHLVRFWKEIVKGVHLSRSRPYQKNDNRFVEQKNYTLVREYLGNERLDTVGQTIALNNLYPWSDLRRQDVALPRVGPSATTSSSQ
jgi:hypothetical protein